MAQCRRWTSAFASERKDHRFYEIVEDTIHPEFEYRYFIIHDDKGEPNTVQPFFVLDQDLIAGTGPRMQAVVAAIRRLWPDFLKLRTLMVGCVAGEGHLDGADEPSRREGASRLASAIVHHARAMKARLVVMKEFPAKYRPTLACFIQAGFARIPSLPMTRLEIKYDSFEDYMSRALHPPMRAKLRRKFRALDRAPPVEMSLATDITPIIGEIYPLYLQVYTRSKQHFEKLTPEFLCALGRAMPDKSRFFVWRQLGKVIAFNFCMVQSDTIYSEYIGLDYAVALDLHLYFVVVRDVIAWAIANGYRSYCSSGLNYDPKYHLRHRLDPIDLYVRHTSAVINPILRRLLPWLEPTRNDPLLRRFENFDEMWDRS
nr:GNAT family N-acetyltransferase [Microvirga terricola]